MPIGKRCNYCHKRIPIGGKCSCRNTARYKEKKTADVYINAKWLEIREKCIEKCFGIDVFAFNNDNQIRFGHTVHHIYPVEDYPNKSFDIENLIYLTEQNHRIVHRMLEDNFEATVQLLLEYRGRFEREFGVGGRRKCF